jgi:hypothetical protein
MSFSYLVVAYKMRLMVSAVSIASYAFLVGSRCRKRRARIRNSLKAFKCLFFEKGTHCYLFVHVNIIFTTKHLGQSNPHTLGPRLRRSISYKFFSYSGSFFAPPGMFAVEAWKPDQWRFAEGVAKVALHSIATVSALLPRHHVPYETI